MTSTPVDRSSNCATPNSGTGHTRLPLRDVLARLEAGIARHTSHITLPPAIPIDGAHGTALLALLLDAAAHHYDTVRIHSSPDGPVIAVSRRRYRPRRHTH